MLAFIVATGMATVLPQTLSQATNTFPQTLPSPQKAKAEIVACGLPATHVSVRYERDMQEDVVWISSSESEISSDVLTCMSQVSVNTSYHIFFWDSNAQRRYGQIYYRISNDANVSHAREWLRSRNLLSKMPKPIKGEPLAKYAEAVEVFCGVEKGALLSAVDEHNITFTQGALGHPSRNGIEGAVANNIQFECVMNAISATDPQSLGFFFGIIGNTAKAQ